MMRTISLALGSGGARGYAHIGVIEELEKQGYQIKDDMILVNGGVINPLPINVIALDNTDLKIAVNMDANIENKYIINIPKEYKTSEEILYERFIK